MATMATGYPQIENAGSLTLHIAQFGSTADGDTWASYIPSIVGYWGNSITDGTQTKEGVDIALTTASTGLLTFNLGETKASGIMVYVLSRT